MNEKQAVIKSLMSLTPAISEPLQA